MTCGQCGSEIDPGNQFCQACGAAAPAAPAPASKPRSAALTYLGLAALLVVGAGATFWALSAGGDKSARSSRSPAARSSLENASPGKLRAEKPSDEKPSDEPVVTATVREEAAPVDVSRRDSPPAARRAPAPRPAAKAKPKAESKPPAASEPTRRAAKAEPEPEPLQSPSPPKSPADEPDKAAEANESDDDAAEEPAQTSVFSPPPPRRPADAAPPAPSGPPPPPPIQTRAPVRRSSSADKDDDEPEPGGRVLRPSAAEVKEAEEAAAKIPTSGNLYWTGNVDKNQPVIIENGAAAEGLLEGDPLPGKPVEVQMPSAVCSIREAPSAANGWARLVFSCSKNIKGQSVNIQWYLR